jgi:hypothetical protein
MRLTALLFDPPRHAPHRVCVGLKKNEEGCVDLKKNEELFSLSLVDTVILDQCANALP